MEDALSLAEAGPFQGQQAGLASVRLGKCEIVPAGRTLLIESTRSAEVVYATEKGRHVGYTPVGIVAPLGSAGIAACLHPGFCAVRPGPAVSICPEPEQLSLPTPEAKAAAKCRQLSDNNVGEVTQVNERTAVLNNLFGGAQRYHVARGDLVGIEVQPKPTPALRGWCKPGDWCVTTTATMLCSQRAAYERILAAPTGEARRAAILAEPSCRVVIPGNPMKPSELPAVGDANKIIRVDHPILKTGWATADAFKVVSLSPPLRFTDSLAKFSLAAPRTPVMNAVELYAQGTRRASATYRASKEEVIDYCARKFGLDRQAIAACVADQGNPLTKATADCTAKKIALDSEEYQFTDSRQTPPTDGALTTGSQWYFRDMRDGSAVDETSPISSFVDQAFDALCPGVNHEAQFSLVFRDARARFPQELVGFWAEQPSSCGQGQAPGERAEDAVTITPTEIRGYEHSERINRIRRSGGGWTVDSSWEGEGETALVSADYRFVSERLSIVDGNGTRRLIRCSR